MDKKNVFNRIKNDKTIIVVVILIIIGVLLMIVPSNKTNSSSKIINDSQRLEEYGNSIESKIAELCSKVRGVSDVSVSIYFDSGFETIYAFNEESKQTSSGFNSEKKYVTVGSGNDESMVCVVEKMPSICGIAIVCKGGGSPLIANELINLISAAYGVPKNKIYIAEGKR